jgi:uncharacterized protein GlcG (DUF336 family)
MTDSAASAYLKSQSHLTLGAAEVVLAAAVAHAESLGVAAVVVVTDSAGGVTSLARPRQGELGVRTQAIDR